MADVWVMSDGTGDGEEAWKSGVQAVVFPNHKIIAQSDMDKRLLQEQIEEAQRF